MKQYAKAITFWVLALALAPGLALGFDSGSTGADGAFNPTVNTQLPLPPSGIFNFTSVNIPSGVTVTFQKNTTNTPVTILASGSVTIAGTLDVSGKSSTNAGAAGDGDLGDDGIPGVGGPGGFDGGRGGLPNATGGTGLGPGGGSGGSSAQNTCFGSPATFGGGGGGFGATGGNSFCSVAGGGPSYGSSVLLPLIGGSGGGGGAGGTNFGGSGGGGGGGAILIAASGTVNVIGPILADGGGSGSSAGSGCGPTGGGGSGGGIRIVATTIAGDGNIFARGGGPGGSCISFGGAGADGRIRLESESFTRTAATNPPFTASAPGTVFVAGFPTLTISSVAGVAAPAAPTGNADITLPASTPNPVTVVFTTTGVPVGNTVRLTVTPASGGITSVISPALTGSTASATASVSVNLSSGPSVLQATTTFTIVAALGDVLAPFAQGERVEKITLVAMVGKPNKAILVTVSGKEFEVPAAVLSAVAGREG